MTVSVREFRTHLSRYLAEVREGGVVEITSRRRVVARLSGVAEKPARGADRLVAEGTARWEGGKPRGAAIRLSPEGSTLSDLVLEERG